MAIDGYAPLIGRTDWAIREMLWAGKIPCIRDGRRVLLDVNDMDSWKESNVRTGFFEYDEYVKVRDALPSSLKPLLIAAYYTGIRRGELLGLQWHQVDIWAHRIVLEKGSTKNGEARLVYMYGELFDAILAQKKIRDTNFSECQNVFFDHHTGMPMSKDFRPTWEKALASVNLAGRLFHDLRRTAVRNMVRSGVSEVVAMRVSGHKTRNVSGAGGGTRTPTGARPFGF